MARAGRAPFDAADPRGRESLVEARDRGLRGQNYYARRDGGNAPYGRAVAGAVEALNLREGVVARLARIETALALHGLGLWIHDGWRPVATQLALWDHFAATIAAANPGWDTARIEREVATFVSDPRRFSPADPATWPPHSTGGAVDLVLRDLSTDRALDMGAGFDEASPASATDWCECELAAGRMRADDPRLVARRVLYWSMMAEGFTNYPAEFWHFDLGTRLWAAMRRDAGDDTAAAFYATVESAP